MGEKAFQLARQNAWIISPAVLLELEILHEIKRIRATPDQVIAKANEAGDVSIAGTLYSDVVHAARSLSWTRDPVDRLVTAAAIADGAKLLTADRTILANFPDAVWD